MSSLTTDNVIRLHPSTAPIHGPGRPKDYRTKDGKKVPSVTTITGRFADKQALIGWAYGRGKEGLELYESRDAAAEVGAMVHQWVQDTVRGVLLTVFPTAAPEALTAALNGLEAFNDWRRMCALEIKSTELPLVSESMRFGGTYDAVGIMGGKVVLLDWKTGSQVYGEVLAQLGAYRHLLRENGIDTDGAHCLRFGKEHGDFHHHGYPASLVDLGWEWFKMARAMYDIDKQLAKAVK